MKSRYSYIDAIFLSIFSKDLYRDVAVKWQGYGIKYLLILVSFIAITASFFSTYNLYKFSTKEQAIELTNLLFGNENISFESNLNRVLQVISQFPRIDFSDGRMNISGEDPHVIVDPLTKNDLFIFDTTGKTNSLENSTALALFTSRNIVVRSNNEKSRGYGESISYRDWQNRTIDLRVWNSFFDLVSKIPELKIENNRLILTDEQERLNSPIIITLDSHEKPIIIVDIKNEYNNLEESGSYLLLQEQGFYLTNFEDIKNTLYYSYDELDSALFYQGILYSYDFLKKLLYFALPVVTFLSILFIGFFSGLIMVTLLTASGILIAKYLSYELPTKIIYRLCCVSLTPVITASILLPQFLSKQGLVYFLIAIGYTYFSISSQDKNLRLPPDGSSSSK